jgi:hypothetical protein
MTIFDRWRSSQPSAATELDTYLDELDSGVLAPRTELDPSIAAVASRLHQAGLRTAEPAGLRSQLWEDLMQSATPIEAGSLAAPIPPDSRRLREISAPFGSPRKANDRFRHTFEWIAAAILILGLLGAAYIGQRGGTGDPPQESPLFASTDGTPGPPCDEATGEPVITCFNIVDHLGSNWIDADLMEDSEQQVELQGWAITPGSTYHGISATSSTGAVVDFVLDGAYVATFNVQVILVHSTHINRPVEYIAAGQPVELVRGDSVSYSLGGLVELQNPLEAQRLEFKRAVIYTGDATAFSATSEGVTTRLEGTRTIPLVLSYTSVDVALYYIQRYPGISILPKQWSTKFTIGPVDPQFGTDGFVLVIGSAQG